MTSAKQVAANRANAEKSTGPRTEAGKRISRLNSTVHGFSGHTVLKTPEEDAAYRTYYQRLLPDLSPANAIEHDFAERIIYASWRIHRASAIESNLFALAEAAFDTGDTARDGALNDANTYQLNERTINLLSLYQQRLQRGIHKDLAMLRQMQKDRLAAERLSATYVDSALTLALQLLDNPAVLPVIGSVCQKPPLDPAPPHAEAFNDLSNMAA